MENIKQGYFSPQTIERKARDMIDEVGALSRAGRFAYIPARSALLVLDMQRCFFDPSSHAYIPSAPAILPGVCSLIDAYKAGNLPVMITRHLNSPEETGPMATWWREPITGDDPMSELIDPLDTASSTVIVKKHYDAFFDTPLEGSLRERSVGQVVICGVMTHLCCETTARSAFMRGFEVFFAVDGTATYNEIFHRASLVNLAHGFAIPVTIRDMLAALEDADER